jgi:predicted metalloendopeptidase
MRACPRTIIIAVAATLLMIACSSKPAKETPVVSAPAATPPAAAPAGPKPSIGDFGLDLTAGKPEVKPGDDFFTYANGNWAEHFEIPPDRSSFGVFNQLDERSKSRVRELIESAATSQPAPGSPAQKIGDYYAAFMDEAAIEARGVSSIQDDLKRISSANSKQDMATLFGQSGFTSLFDIDLPPDPKNPDQYTVMITQSRLGLPDRDYYLKDDPKLEEIREKYTAYIEQMLTLGGMPESHANARDIMAFETEAAKVQWPIEKRRDVDAIYNPRTKPELIAYAGGFNWNAFLDASEIGSRQNLVVGELTAIRDLATLFNRTPLPTLKAWMTFHYLSDHAAYLPKRFDAARFDFYGRTLRGQPQQRERC